MWRNEGMDYSKHIETLGDIYDSEIVRDYSDFSGIPVPVIVQRIWCANKINAESYCSYENQYEFYEKSKIYIYDLLGASWSPAAVANKLNASIPNLLHFIKEHSGRKFMEFGGGTGVFSEIMHEWAKKDVTYVDIQSHATEFALWRFKKKGIKINCQIIGQRNFEIFGAFDIVFSDAVFEHLDPVQQIVYAKKLCGLLKSSGVLIMLIDPSGPSEQFPMHHKVDFVNLYSTIAKSGMRLIQLHKGYASIWKMDN
jgi:phospholipid N-methyltransferase